MTEWGDLDYYRDPRGVVWADADGTLFRTTDEGGLMASEWETIQAVRHDRGPLKYLGRGPAGGPLRKWTDPI